MNSASRDFDVTNKQPVGLGSQRSSKSITIESAKQYKNPPSGNEAANLTIKGSPAAPGETEGTATVIVEAEKLLTVTSGTILIYPHASPLLTPLLPKIKGLVTDTGGLLAPVVSIAREYGIPVVAGTSSATRIIKNGDTIHVDGAEGRVWIISDA